MYLFVFLCVYVSFLCVYVSFRVIICVISAGSHGVLGLGQEGNTHQPHAVQGCLEVCTYVIRYSIFLFLLYL